MPFFILFLFIVWRSLDFFVSFLAPRFVPYLGYFSYPKDIRLFHLPSWIYSFANFDGVFYIRIAQAGYHQYEQAFFPLYPLFIRLLSPIFSNNQLVTGLIVSNVAFFLGLLILQKLVKENENGTFEQLGEVRRNEHALGAKNVTLSFPWVIFFLLVFPTSFFFTSIYTEGFFFLLIVGALFFLTKKQFVATIIFAFLAGLTRVTGVLLIIPILFITLPLLHRKKYILQSIILILSPLLGILSYCLYLLKTTGDPFFFFTSQTHFDLNRSTHLILVPQVIYRYIKIFITAQHNFQYFVSILELTIFSIIFLALLWEFFNILKEKKYYSLRFGLNIFSLFNLIIPTLTGTFLSIPRFALLSISFFFILAELKNPYLKTAISLLFFILHVVLLIYFIQGYFVS